MLETTRRSLLLGAAAAAIATSIAPAYATPKRGGHLRIGLSSGSTQDSLDPVNPFYDSVLLATASSRSSLTRSERDGSVTSNLAVKWEPSADLKTWTFELRSGVSFHSGKALEVDDVIASINIHRGEDTTSPLKSLLAPIKEISKVGGKTVVFTLDAPNADFPKIVSDIRLVVLASKDGKVDRQSLDGTGPYAIEKYIPGERFRLKRNPNYWDLEKAAFFDSAEVLIITDAAARMNALRSGQVDLINTVDLKTLIMLKRAQNIKIDDLPSGRFYMFGMMYDVAPFNDKNVRSALKYAIDRQELVDKIVFGHGTLGNDQPIDPTHQYFNPEISQTAYDPDKAKYYLQKAGLSSLKVPLSVSEAAFQGATAAGSLFVESAGKAGISIELTREPDDGYFENVWSKKPFTADWWTKQTSADAQFSQGFGKNASYNATHFNNERFEKLLLEARGTLDESRRKPMYQELQTIVHDESGAIIPVFANFVWASKSNLMHQESLNSDWDLDGFRCIERWWFS
uniref:ABC transporter substrate-binding protein n=1 Tax=Ensifer adhaerens TaxID=106592 RepID=UPI003F494F7F